jgi:hypothetical protein
MKHPESYNLRNRLHTEVLKEKYGKVNTHVLRDDDHIRDVLLMDEHLIARTYALTIKNKQWQHNDEIYEVNKAIQNGEGIGEAFKSRGFVIQKNVLDVYVIKLAEWLRLAFETNNKTAKARIAEFIVKKGNLIYNYGTITEVYAPDFRTPQVNETDKAQINIPSSVFKSFGFSKEEIWTFLEKKVIASNLAKLYSSVVAEMKEKVHNTIMEAPPLWAI